MSTDKTPTKKTWRDVGHKTLGNGFPARKLKLKRSNPIFCCGGTVCMWSLEIGSHHETAQWRINREQSQDKGTQALDGDFKRAEPVLSLPAAESILTSTSQFQPNQLAKSQLPALLNDTLFIQSIFFKVSIMHQKHWRFPPTQLCQQCPLLSEFLRHTQGRITQFGT